MNRGVAAGRMPRPLLKWAGGKRQLLKEISAVLPEDFRKPDRGEGAPEAGSRDVEATAPRGRYLEPFLGGGALLFHLLPRRGTVSDINPELINFYTVLKTRPEELLARLEELPVDSESYYRIRSWDREAGWESRSPVCRAARLLYLNRTCYNGLFRVNRRGEFNVPYGRYRNPRVVQPERLREAAAFLAEAEIRLVCQDFELTMEEAREGDFVYLDPPYDPVNTTSSFTGYTSGGFGRQEQVRLRDACRRLDRRGVRFLLSNSATPFILDLYREFLCDTVQASRNINSRGEGRGPIPELLARNYPV